MHERIYDEYRKVFCNEKGEQKTNLKDEEMRGIKKIKMRVKDKNSIVMKTDKSGKMCIQRVTKQSQERKSEQ